jgi:hypothetical protein
MYMGVPPNLQAFVSTSLYMAPERERERESERESDSVCERESEQERFVKRFPSPILRINFCAHQRIVDGACIILRVML